MHILEVTVGYPSSLAFALVIRDVLKLRTDLGVPATAVVNVPTIRISPRGHGEHLASAWSTWWERLLTCAVSRDGLARLNGMIDLPEPLPPMLAQEIAPLRDGLTAWVREWHEEAISGIELARGRIPALLTGVADSGFNTPRGRRRLRRAGRDLPNDVPVAVLPVEVEWGHVHPLGLILISSTVARDAEVARAWFGEKLWMS